MAVTINFDADPDVQIAQARAQGVMLPEEFYALPPEKRALAFTVSTLAKLDQIQAVADALARMQEAGGSFDAFLEWALRQDWDLPYHRLETIYRNAVQTAYMAGHWRFFEETKDSLPYLMYDAINDGRTRPSHLALDNVIRPVDDPFWRTHSPPLGHRCRCSLRALTAKAAMQRGGPTASIPAEAVPDEGWGSDPRGWSRTLAKLLADKASKTHKAIAAAMHDVAPWRTATAGTDEGDWHDAAFMGSPQWLKAAVAKRGPLKGGVRVDPGAMSAHYSVLEDAISINDADKTSLHSLSTWRHEYGHAIDMSLRRRLTFRSSEDDFLGAMAADADDLIRLGGHGVEAKAVRSKLDRAYKKAIDSLKSAEDRDAWLTKRFAMIGLDFEEVKGAMREHAWFASNLSGIGLYARYARIAVAIAKRDAQGLLDAMAGTDPIERRLTYSKGAVGSLSDLIGSAALNRVGGFDKSGFGHKDSYYQDISWQAAECFANLTCMYADSRRVFAKIVESMTPRMAALFKEILK